jgi:D-lactate dehydrogenase (cytochrome)
MDLVDLFVGSEGTLGIITAATLRIVQERPAACLVLVPFSERRAALEFVRHARDAASATWRSGDLRGVDVSAIEYMDQRCLALVREDGIDRINGVRLPDNATIALLVTLELPPGTRAEQAFDEIGRAREPGAPDTPLIRFLTMLSDAFRAQPDSRAPDAMDDISIAVPGDHKRAAQLIALREAVPAAVNQRIGMAQRTVDARIEKTAADMIVPFDKFESMLDCYEDEFRRRGLDAAIWGHISDGNVHPNILPKSWGDVEAGKAAILECGREAIRAGGAPLAEHGVGRNPVKQRLLQELYGEHGIEEMRQVKRAIDPEWKLAPGVLFNS